MRNGFLSLSVVSLCAVIFCSCSLDYGTTYSLEETYPELVLKQAVIDRTENGVLTASIHCEQMEQYKSGEKVMAEGIDFSVMDKNGKVTSSGKAGYLSCDSANELYEFYQGIYIFNEERGIEITTDALRWNGKTEQLTGEKDKSLAIRKNNTSLTGTGFSASAISNSFSFSRHVSGNIRENNEE